MKAKIWWVALLCGAALTWPALAQEGGTQGAPPPTPPPETEKKEAPAEAPAAQPKKKSSLEDPPMHRWGGFTLSFAGWSAQPTGADEQVAVFYPSGQFPRPVTIPFDSNIRQSASAAYHLPNNLGTFLLHYDSMHNTQSIFESTPGQFLYGESLVDSIFAGAFDDGFADTVSGENIVKTRETRIQYQNTAFDSKRVHLTWGAGIVNVDHNEQLNVTYYTLVPNLPALIPPIDDIAHDPLRLQPDPDRVLLQSDFSGTGFSGSLDAEFKFHPRLSVISGLSVGLVRGHTSSIYKSFASFYQSTLDGHYIDKAELENTLQFGPTACDPENGIVQCIDAITQVTTFNGYYVPSAPQAAQTFEGYVGVQSMIWRGIRLFATFRELYYQNVGQFAVLHENSSVTTTSKSVGYEGYLLGASWRF